MLCRRVIPCLDIRAERVVKGVRFQSLRDVGDPAELAARYEAQGADEIVLLDVSATIEERLAGLRCVERTRRRLSIPLTVGGGVRTAEDARRLLEAGADRVGVNTAAVADPSLVKRLADSFGSQCVVVAIDAARVPSPSDSPSWRVSVRAATQPVERDPAGWARECAQLGAGEILLTCIDRDGTGTGYDLPLIESVSSAVPIPIIASGGAAHPEDLPAAIEAGASAVLVASMLHDGKWTVEQLKAALARGGVEVRL